MVIIIYEVPTNFSRFSFLIFLFRNFYFCTEIYISVLGYTLLYCCHIFLSIFLLIFCTATFIFVPRFIFLYWDKYCCTVVYMNFTVLKNIVAQPMNMLVLELMFLYWEIDIFFTGAVICVLRIGDIFPYWSLYFCTEINISVLGYSIVVLVYILLYW